jgi:DNA-binding FadR family transcriptional regulator
VGAAAFTPVRARLTYEEVVFQLEAAILEGRLRPGDRLPSERELAEQMGVSRPSIREAIRVLESGGVIEARRGPGAGLTVTAERNAIGRVIALQAATRSIPIGDLVSVRAALEAMAARLAAKQGGSDELPRLIHDMRIAGPDDEFLSLDNEFHQAIARASGNQLLPLLMEALRDAMARQMREGFARLDDPVGERRRLTAQHANIAKQIELKNEGEAVDAVLAHINRFYDKAMSVGAGS